MAGAFWTMELSNPPSSHSTVLLVEEDVILRLGLGEYLRACGFKVIEAANQTEAKLVLQKGPPVHIMLLDARLSGDGGGFKLSQWTRRTQPKIQVILTGTLVSKTEAAAKLCETKNSPPYSIDELKERIESMRSRQKKTVKPRASARRPRAMRG